MTIVFSYLKNAIGQVSRLTNCVRFAPFLALELSIFLSLTVFGTSLTSAQQNLLPDDLEPITVENVDKIVPLARLGRGDISGVAWSPDGKTLAIASSIGLWLYDSRNLNASPRFISSNRTAFSSVVFSHDGTIIAAIGNSYYSSWGSVGYVWDAATGQEKSSFGPDAYGEFNNIAFSDDDSKLVILDRRKGIITFQMPGPSYVSTVGFSELTGSEDDVYSANISPNGQIVVAVDYRGSVSMGNILSGEKYYLGKIEMASDNSGNKFIAPNIIAFSADGKKVLVRNKNRLLMWDLTGVNTTPISFEREQSSALVSVAMSSDGNFFASGSSDGNVQLWDATSNTLLQQFAGHNGEVEGVAFSPDKKMLVSWSWDSAMVWEVPTGKQLGTLTNYNFISQHIAIDPALQYVASGTDRYPPSLWDLDKSKESVTLNKEPYYFYGNSVAFSPDGKILGSMTNYSTSIKVDPVMLLWDPTTAKLVRHIEFPSNLLIAGSSYLNIAFSLASNKIVSIPYKKQNELLIWDLQSVGDVSKIDYPITIRAVSFSPDGKNLAILTQDNQSKIASISVLDAVSSQGQHNFKVETNPDVLTYRLIFSSDETKLAIVSGDTWVIDLRTGDEIRFPQMSADSFSADSRLLATHTVEEIQLVDSVTGKLIYPPKNCTKQSETI